MATQIFSVNLEGGPLIQVTVDIANRTVASSEWFAIGPLSVLETAREWKPRLLGSVDQLPVPVGSTPAELMIKKIVLQIKGRWPVVDDPELCHCRKIPLETVERAVILGAHTLEKVRQRTSANTGCGTCMPDVERVLALYLK